MVLSSTEAQRIFSGGEDPLSIHLTLRLHRLRTAGFYNERFNLCGGERGYGWMVRSYNTIEGRVVAVWLML